MPGVSTNRPRRQSPPSALGEAGATRNGPENRLACVVRPPSGPPGQSASHGAPSEPAARYPGLRPAVPPVAAQWRLGGRGQRLDATASPIRALERRAGVHPGRLRLSASSGTHVEGLAACGGGSWGITPPPGQLSLRMRRHESSKKGVPPHATAPLSTGQKPGGTPWGVAWGRGG